MTHKERMRYVALFTTAALLLALAWFIATTAQPQLLSFSNASATAYTETSIQNDSASPGALMYHTSAGVQGYLYPGQTFNINTPVAGEIRSIYIGVGACANLYQLRSTGWILYQRIRTWGYYALPYLPTGPTSYWVAWRWTGQCG